MICNNKDCQKEFEPKTHNQKYCSDNCCRVATNKRIMEKYYEKKAIKNGAIRGCKSCKVQLSRYNSSDICAKCQKIKYRESRSMLMEIVNDIG